MRLAGLVVLAAACMLALATQASATIVINRGIAGVNLGMRQVEVRAKLGRPRLVVHGKNEFGPYTEFRYTGYVVAFQNNGTVTSVVTTLAREKTPAGIGVGSPWPQVRAKVPHVRCEGRPLLGDCHVGDLLPGRKVTDFFVRGGRVDRVVVGIVLD
jgi:outer membrane protein assembly factor BamE (lipoprotein component of BamABCDE complex)